MFKHRGLELTAHPNAEHPMADASATYEIEALTSMDLLSTAPE
jgi:hypothetical protein